MPSKPDRRVAVCSNKKLECILWSANKKFLERIGWKMLVKSFERISKSTEIWFLFLVVLLTTNVASVFLFGVDNSVFGVNGIDAEALFQEDALFENLSAIFYFLSAGIFLWGFFKQPAKRKYWCLFFAVLLFFVGGEEISWGQRIFGIVTPDTLETVNVQGEFNIHNINGIHQNVRMLAVLFILALCFFIPFSNYFSIQLRKLYSRWGVPIYPISAVLGVVFALLFMIIPRILGYSDGDIFVTDEIGEFILSFSWIPFAVSNGIYKPQRVSEISEAQV